MLRRIRTRVQHDAGIALIMVIGWTLVLGTLVTAGIAYAIQSNVDAHRSQDWGAALSAAQAGIEDYVARLNRNDNYGRTWDCTNTALKGPKATGNTCGWTASTVTGWLPVVATAPKGAAFHYDVDATGLDQTGTITVVSTGRVGTVTRTIEAAIGRGGSTDFLYYTDFEDADPTNTTVYGSNPGNGSTVCGSAGAASALYAWNPASSRNDGSSPCTEITFASGDVLNGRVHFNDLPLSQSGAQFVNGFETAAPNCATATAPNYTACLRYNSGIPVYGVPASGGAPAVVVPPKYSEPLYLDDTSAKFATYPGCHYYGATRIKFGTPALGQMTVWSKDSAGMSTGTNCGTFTAGNSYTQVVNVPTDQVIYDSAGSAVHQCLSGEIGDGLPLGTYTGAPNTTYTYDLTMQTADQYCGQGNLYIEGILKGRVSIAAENSIVVTGDLLLSSGVAGTDIAGLVAGNSVEVFHPWVDQYKCTTSIVNKKSVTTCAWQNAPAEVAGWPTRYNDPAAGNVKNPTKGIQIAASIQTLQHSFWVQEYNKGSQQGTLLVLGSIAQRWRGIVGQNGGSGTGYLKSYQYDTRLKWSSPPYFPQWTNAKWGPRHTGETTPSYSSVGTYTGP
jgi:hypothetical protein